MISTPVGHRCRDCAGLRVLPHYQITAAVLLKAIGAGVGMAIAGGIGWALLFRLGFLFALIVAGFGIGYGTGEAISRAVRSRQGTVLTVIAGVSAGAGVLLGNVFLVKFFTDFPWSFALRQAFSLNIWEVLAGLLAVGMAVGRLRR